MDHEANIRKMRILTFVQMSELDSEMTFEHIEKELQLEPNDVEEFIINGKAIKYSFYYT